MSKKTFPITQLQISNKLGRSIKSPIHVSNLKTMGIDTKLFLEKYAPLFSELPWDPYDARRLRLEFFIDKFPDNKEEIQTLFADYYLGNISLERFDQWIKKLSQEDKEAFNKIQPWRRRSVAQFALNKRQARYFITRQTVPQFSQNLDKSDLRSLPRVFAEAPDHHIENHLFSSFLIRIYKLVQKLHPDCKATITVHFMSVKATEAAPGDNSPEGAHEDGANYIVSALVINRVNLTGGETQILEKLEDGSKEIIFKHTLQPGEFVFQADTGEEHIYGNDLWHHVTPFSIDDASKGEGWRDIIGFDIALTDADA